jgi:phosphoribosylpyrophosphate synthetase
MNAIGIVGARAFTALDLVDKFVSVLPAESVVVSGGANGVDNRAAKVAGVRGLKTVVHLPDLSGCKTRHEFTERYYARNQRIVDNVDMLVAFTDKDSGGTWDTVKRALRAGLRVEIIRSTETRIYQRAVFGLEPRHDNGPYVVARINGVALHRRRSMDPLAFAAFVNGKDHNPGAVGAKMAAEFLDYCVGHVGFMNVFDVVTTPPVSMRNSDHPVVLAAIAAFGGLFETAFQPWNKPRRGNGTPAAEPVLMGGVGFRGKTVLLVDDVVTTGRTFCGSRDAIMAAGAVAVYGLAYIVM